MEQAITNFFKTLFLYSIRFILPYLPLKVLYIIGNLSGYILIGGKTQIIKNDLRVLFGNLSEPDLDIILRRTMQNFRKDLLEIWTFPKLNRNKINKISYFEGFEHLQNALDKGKGAILCITHFGSWKIILPALGYNGYKVHQIAANPLTFEKDTEASSHNIIMKLELESESSLPAKFIYLDEGKSIRQIYRVLANNEIVVISLDGIIGGKRMSMPFLNGTLLLSTGGASLSLSTEAPSLPIFIVRQKDNKHKIVIHEPVANLNNGFGKEAFIDMWMKSYTRLFEHYVQSYPDHYARYLYTIRKYPLPELGYVLKLNDTDTKKELISL
jgi:KDO2-lipid IV(A) lauroyltransferase